MFVSIKDEKPWDVLYWFYGKFLTVWNNYICRQFEGVIQRLYTGIQCQSCGLRFTAQQTEKYREHLDWHFRQNRRDKGIANVTKYRRWYYQINVSLIKALALFNILYQTTNAYAHTQPFFLKRTYITKNCFNRYVVKTAIWLCDQTWTLILSSYCHFCNILWL